MLAFCKHLIGHGQGVLEDVPHPGRVDGGVGLQPKLVVLPLFVRQAQLASVVRVVGVESLRQHTQQHGHAQEGAGYFE